MTYTVMKEAAVKRSSGVFTVPITAIALCLFLAGCGPAGSGRISGIIHDEDGNPIPGVLIIAVPLDASGAPRTLDSAGSPHQLHSFQAAQAARLPRSTADAKGRFVFKSLAPGLYSIHASAVWSVAAAVLTSVPVTAGRKTDVGPLQARKTGDVSGRVVLEDGSPAGGIPVYIAGSGFAAKTDADGYWTITAVPAGTGYHLIGSKEGYGSGSAALEVPSMRTVSVPEFTVRKGVPVPGSLPPPTPLPSVTGPHLSLYEPHTPPVDDVRYPGRFAFPGWNW